MYLEICRGRNRVMIHYVRNLFTFIDKMSHFAVKNLRNKEKRIACINFIKAKRHID